MRPHVKIAIIAFAFLTAGGTGANAQGAHTESSDAVGDAPLAHETGNNQSQLGTGMTGAVSNHAGTDARGAMNGACGRHRQSGQRVDHQRQRPDEWRQ
jgi:hypothetical protein